MKDASPEMMSIFCGALERPERADRSGYLDAACGNDPELRARIEALLKAHEDAGGPAPANGTQLPTIDEPAAERPGAVIGPYKLLEQIGEGGFGVVFLAEQTEPVRRKVALKVLKPGMDTRQVVARFEAERQALAIMDHPNIARVFDGGATPSGRPYFVMELVKGVPITEFCDQNQLPPRARLELFVGVCQAVQHAHQKGVIHRDLKPSNVLVSRHDTTPVVKVIDFGVAKALGQGLTDKTLVTGLAQMVGTPLYMSPEQAGQSGLDVDTRSDVYSLGVLLYELLTGTTPFTKERFKQAAYDEIRRIIREEEPPKPSTRLSESKDALPSVAAQRHTEPTKLTKLVRGELDWIVMKALEKDRSRRYETANGLAMDVHRYLADEPVLAGPPSIRYRLSKFARRHKSAVALLGVGCVAALALVAAVVGSLYNARLERVLEEKESYLYLNRLLLAEREWAGGNVERAERLLGECPPARRGWEWYYLKRQCHTELLVFRGHTGGVVSIAFSPDGRHIASASEDKTVQVWDAATGQVIHTLRGHTSFAVCLSFSPDGRRLASGSGVPTFAAPGEVKVWDTATGREMLTLSGHVGPVQAVAYSPDGRYLASGSGRLNEHGEVEVWDATTGREVLTFRGHSREVSGLAFSPDGRRLASASGSPVMGAMIRRTEPGEIKVWDPATGREFLTLRGYSHPVAGVAFGPDGRRLAAPSWDGTAKVWDVSTGEAAWADVSALLDCSPWASWPGSASHAAWRLERLRHSPRPGQQVLTLAGHTGGVLEVAFSPDGEQLATAGLDGSVKVWDARTGEEVRTLRGHAQWVSCVRFSPDGRRLASCSEDGTVRVWDATGGREILGRPRDADPIFGLAFSPDGRRLITAGGDQSRPDSPGNLAVWDLRTRQQLRRVRAHASTIRGLAVSPDGARLATAGGLDRAVKVWDAATGRELLSFDGHADRVTGVAFSPDGNLLASAGFDHTVRVWNLASGEPRVLRGHTDRVFAVAFSPDGRHLASAGWDQSVKVWDVTTGELVRTLHGHERVVHRVAFSPDGGRLASACWDGTVKVWDVPTGHEQFTVRAHRQEAVDVAFSPDGARLASTGADRTVKIWDAWTGQELLTLRGHSRSARCVVFSPDGQYLASAGDDGIVRTWDASPSGEEPDRSGPGVDQ